jgi:hypothetical protein
MAEDAGSFCLLVAWEDSTGEAVPRLGIESYQILAPKKLSALPDYRDNEGMRHGDN